MDLNSETAHVLVVDDEGAIRYSVSKTLQRIGYEVDEAASGEDALSMVKKREYDVVLTDIKMPGITGVDLLRKIKEASPDAIVILMCHCYFDDRVCQSRDGGRKPPPRRA